MAVQDQFDTAVESGIISSDQATALRELFDRRKATLFDEPFRITRSMNEVFIGVGILLLAAGVVRLINIHALTGWPMAILASWISAEIFVTRLRMTLPGALLSAMFGASIYGALLWATESQALSAGAAAVCGLVHLARFRVPFMAFVIGLAVTAAALSGVEALFPHQLSSSGKSFSLLVLGLISFALAISMDRTDITRASLPSRIAFWLHALAAPMLVHGAMMLITSSSSNSFILPHPFVHNDMGMIGNAGRFGVAIVTLSFMALSVAVNRRAIFIVASFYASAILAFELGNTTEAWLAALSAVGMIVILAGMSWTKLVANPITAAVTGSRRGSSQRASSAGM